MQARNPAKMGEVLAPGTLVAGRFRVDVLLGSGGMADVYRAADVATGRMLAVKLLREDIADDPEAVQRLRREGEVLATLRHPAIVELETFGSLDDGRIFIAMELLEGETLGDRMRRGPTPPADLTPVVEAVAGGLQIAHERDVVHRDLKPDNVFLCASGVPASPRVKILDFGISKVYGSEKLTQTGQILGTPRYMAPEQLAAERDLDARVDVYALGVILYEALSGQSPFLNSSASDLIVAILNGQVVPLRSVCPDLPPAIETVVMRAMASAREARYASVRDLARAWVDAAPPSTAEASTRDGYRTEALGTMGLPDAQQPSGAADRGRTQGDLKPGTFSAFAAPAGLPPTREMAAVTPGQAASPSAPAAPGSVRRRSDPDDEAVLLPGMRRRGPLLVLLGLVGVALLAWGGWQMWRAVGGGAAAGSGKAAAAEPRAPGRTAGPADPVRPLPGGAEPPTAAEQPTGAIGGDAEVEAMHDGGSASPDGEDVSAAAAPQGPEPARRDRTPRRVRRTDATDRLRTTFEAEEQEESGSPLPELLRDARAAHRAGDPRRCAELVGRALQRGAPASTLKLLADCELARGNRVAARRAYERFCRLVPDHPAIGEVRARAESLGGRCP